jgi:hypothetical protein
MSNQKQIHAYENPHLLPTFPPLCYETKQKHLPTFEFVMPLSSS